MDLDEYLLRSRKKRSELVKAAEVFMNSTMGFGNSPILDETHSVYNGPTPQKLKLFESEVNYQLRKMFTPGLNDTCSNYKILATGSVDECIRNTYSRFSPTLKRRQLVILPKQLYGSSLRVPEMLARRKQVMNSLEDGTAETNTSFFTEQKKKGFVKKIQKGDLLLPVLSTVGTRDYRSKVYKYK